MFSLKKVIDLTHDYEPTREQCLIKPSIRDGHGAGADPATFFGSGFEFLGKTRIRIQYVWYDVYRM